LENIDQKKYPVPENWHYEKAKELFVTPEIMDPKSIVVSVVTDTQLFSSVHVRILP